MRWLGKIVFIGCAAALAFVCISARGYAQEAPKAVAPAAKEMVKRDWFDRLKLYGDFRLRYQYDKQENDDKGRHRQRIRLRAGIKADIHKYVDIGVRLASGSDDRRSTNQTMDSNFETKPVWLDEAYLVFSPKVRYLDTLSLTAGKFTAKNTFFRPSDLLWDSDITFEGQALTIEKQVNEGINLFFNAGLHWVDEIGGDDNDALLGLIQPGIELDFLEKFSLDLGVAFYTFANVKGSELFEGGNTTLAEVDLNGDGDTRDAGERPEQLQYDYDCINPAFQFTCTWSKYKAALFFEYVSNLNSEPDDRDGFTVGTKFGSKKIKNPLTWELGINYRRLEADAFMDLFPDSDAYGGATNVQGIEIKGKVAIVKNVFLALDYYNMDIIEGGDNVENLFQVDLSCKF